MSLQETLEAALETYAVLAIPGLTILRGPASTPDVEGNGRALVVRMVRASATRLDFSQTEWRDTFALTFFWSRAGYTRSQAIDDWEAFRLVMDTAEGLTLGNPGITLERAWLSSMAWGEAVDGHFRTLVATVEMDRVE